MGAEWAVAKICGPAAGCTSPLTACPAASTLMDVAPDGFSVTVTCAMSSYTEGVTSRYIFLITSTATVGGSPGGLGYVERSVNAFVEFPS